MVVPQAHLVGEDNERVCDGGSNPEQEDEEDSDEDESFYEVEKILDKRQIGKRFQYLVKWVGFPADQATWEPPTNLQNVKNMVKEFEMALGMQATTNSGGGSTIASNTTTTAMAEDKNTKKASIP